MPITLSNSPGSDYYNPTPAPKSAPAPASQVAPGPTSFWSRLARVGIGRFNYANVVEHQNVNANNQVLKSGVKSVENVSKGVGGFAFSVGKGIVKAGSVTGSDIVNLENKGLSLIPGYKKTGGGGGYQSVQDSLNKSGVIGKQVAKFIGKPTARQNISDVLQTALLGVGGPGLKAGEDFLAKVGVAKGTKVLSNTGLGLLFGAAQGVGQGKKFSPTQTVKTALETAAFAGGSTITGGIAKNILKKYWGTASKIPSKTTVIPVKEAPKELPTGTIANKLSSGVRKELPAPKATQETATKGFTIPSKGVSQTTSGVFGKAARQAGNVANIKQVRLNTIAEIDARLAKVEQGKTIMSSQTRKDLFNTRQVLATGNNDHLLGKNFNDTIKNVSLSNRNIHNQYQGEISGTIRPRSNGSSSEVSQTVSEKLKNRPSGSQAQEVGKPSEPSISAKLTRPKVPPKEEEPLVNTNKPVNSLVNKFTPTGLKGKLNPVDASARQGNTTFANTIRGIAGRKVYALREGNNVASQFDKLYANYSAKGGTAQQFINDIESGKLGSKAHELWDKVHEQSGQQMSDLGIIKGVKKNYVGRVAQFTKRGYKAGGTGLSKGGSFSKARTTVADEFGISHEKYATHAEFQKAVQDSGGQVLSDPRDILRHTLPSKLEAIENAKGLQRLDKTPMSDGRPATVTYDVSKGLPAKYADYDKTLLTGRAVHPQATNTLKTLVHTYTKDEINNPIAKVNSFAKQIITLNGMIHGKNFGLASLRQQGAIHTVGAMLKANKDLSSFGEDNIKRAIVKGDLVPFEQNKQDMFDQLSNPTFTKTWDKVSSFPGKVMTKEREFLFNKLGNHLQFSTYFNVEKQMLKQGMPEDEAARVAGSAAKNVSFISSPVETSLEFRKDSRLLFFAGQYFKSTLNEVTKATGLNRDEALSNAAQRAVQRQAAKGIARGLTYLLGLAQGINYATTGHSTFQNKDSKISPVFYVDPKTGKEYHITNWFGQVGDMLHIFGNPVKEMSNKVSPMFQEMTRLYQGLTSGAPDPYTGNTVINKNAPGWRQTSEFVGNFIENMVSPFGFQLSYTQNSTPAKVTFAKLLGYGASTVDNNPMEKDILNQYFATLPSGASKTPPAMSTLEAAARHDLALGKTNTTNLQQLKSQISLTQWNRFMKTGADTQVQRAFDALPNNQKLLVIEKYTPAQLKELNLKGVAQAMVSSSQKATVTSLEAKGFTPQRIMKDLSKIGYSRSQLDQLRVEAKKQARIKSQQSARQPKFKNPLL